MAGPVTILRWRALIPERCEESRLVDYEQTVQCELSQDHLGEHRAEGVEWE